MSGVEQKTSWADDDDSEEFLKDKEFLSGPSDRETLSGSSEKSGVIKTICETTTDKNGNKIRIIKRVRVVPKTDIIQSAIAERKNWQPYGRGAAKNSEDLASVGDFIRFEETKKKQTIAVASEESATLELLKRSLTIEVNKMKNEAIESKIPIVTTPDSSALKGAYVPPALRSRFRASEDPDAPEEIRTLRISNIGTEVTEIMLRNLFNNLLKDTIRPVRKIFMPKDKVTFESRGFAFVEFDSRGIAEEALKKSDGIKIEHYVIMAEWSNRN